MSEDPRTLVIDRAWAAQAWATIAGGFAARPSYSERKVLAATEALFREWVARFGEAKMSAAAPLPDQSTGSGGRGPAGSPEEGLAVADPELGQA